MKWNLDALAAAPEETRALNTPADGIYELSAFHAVPDKWRFSPMGDCGQVPFRGGVVRFVFFKLFGTGIVALLCAARAADRKASFGCALSAAVNAVACAHYALIWRARMQMFPRSLRQFEAPIGNPAADAEDDNKRIGLQDFFVDGWRFSDWAVRAPCPLCRFPPRAHTHAPCQITLPLMVLELWLLASDANPKDEADPLFPGLNGDWCAALQPVMILLGSVYRFYLNSMNMPRGTSWYWYALGAVCWLGAATIFGITVAALRDRVLKDGPIDDVDWRINDATVIDIVLFVQIGYPVISLFETVVLRCNPTLGSRLSLVKDAGYGILDTVSKAGLAIYVATRSALR